MNVNETAPQFSIFCFEVEAANETLQTVYRNTLLPQFWVSFVGSNKPENFCSFKADMVFPFLWSFRRLAQPSQA